MVSIFAIRETLTLIEERCRWNQGTLNVTIHTGSDRVVLKGFFYCSPQTVVKQATAPLLRLRCPAPACVHPLETI
jgi:hypothetical protein